VRRNAWFFAESCGRRPWEASVASAAVVGQARKTGARHKATTRRRGELLLATSRVCDKRCPSRSGWGEAPSASDRGGEAPGLCGAKAPEPRSLTLELSAGRAPATSNRKEASFAGPSVATRDKSCAGRRLPVWCAGFDRSDVTGRARGSFRLQKSTSGARPFAPAGEEPADHVEGLAVQCESIRTAKKRRKPGLGGKVEGSVAGSYTKQERVSRKRVSFGESTCR
jgi:hypothetical protein